MNKKEYQPHKNYKSTYFSLGNQPIRTEVKQTGPLDSASAGYRCTCPHFNPPAHPPDTPPPRPHCNLVGPLTAGEHALLYWRDYPVSTETNLLRICRLSCV